MAKNRTFIKIGLVSFWLFFLLEFLTDIWFGSQVPGYNWKTESLSYLGQCGSPIQYKVTLWGVFFTILIYLFSKALYHAYQSNKWIKFVVAALLIYGLGEGLGSGCFPIDPPGAALTLSGRLHNIFSGIGDAGIVTLPFLLMLMFPRKDYRIFHVYLWFVVGIGFIMAAFFLVAKYYRPDNFILAYKGVWQRIYTFNYYIMLLILSFEMYMKLKHKKEEGFIKTRTKY